LVSDVASYIVDESGAFEEPNEIQEMPPAQREVMEQRLAVARQRLKAPVRALIRLMLLRRDAKPSAYDGLISALDQLRTIPGQNFTRRVVSTLLIEAVRYHGETAADLVAATRDNNNLARIAGGRRSKTVRRRGRKGRGRRAQKKTTRRRNRN